MDDANAVGAEGAEGLRVSRCEDWPLIRQLRRRALGEDRPTLASDPDDESEDVVWLDHATKFRWAAAVLNGVGVGLARVNPAWDGSHVESLWVDPGHRRHRIATRLLHELFRIERAEGVTRLRAWVIEGNRVGWDFHWSLGFRPTGERKHLGGDRWELRLERSLTPPATDGSAGH